MTDGQGPGRPVRDRFRRPRRGGTEGHPGGMETVLRHLP